MLICIDAGHGLGTAGKRCLRSIDPQETREWVLNDRVADRVQKLLARYDVHTMRADDTTGKQDVSLVSRVKKANSAGASLYLSIHHNAGIKGGKGGGIVVYTAPGCSEQSKIVQKAMYDHAVKETGLRGNRSNPVAQSSLYVLRNTKMPAILGEFGFMDSSVDTPIILTDEYAEQVATGIVEALIEVYGLKKTGAAGGEPSPDPPQTTSTTSIDVPILKRGSKGNAVKTVQILLTEYGYKTNGIDGSWGPGMDSAFRKWQKDHGIRVDGSCGPAAWTKLICG